MSHQVKDIIKIMEDIAAPHLAEPWDNIGLLVGSKQASVDKIMVTLDVTNDVIQQAIREKANMIISHHPVLFKSIKEINDTNLTGSILLKLIQCGISVYSAHTNYDKAKGGTDDTLAELLGIQGALPLLPSSSAEGTTTQFEEPILSHDSDSGVGWGSLGRIGKLPESISLEEYLMNIKKVLKSEVVDFIGDPKRKIQKVASCAGAGGDFVEEARKAGADLYITGEAKYHEQLSILDGDMALATFGHYATEYPAIISLKRRLQNFTNALQWKVDVILSEDYGNRFRRLRE
ncbi:MAG: Nif3-like dinuclear metal center hexameric protein [Clostridiales bacterium]|nr:Nif3-like dinuclear metal center hexameric protein [Clostridiales bacterium]